jgi:hypothetical protein
MDSVISTCRIEIALFAKEVTIAAPLTVVARLTGLPPIAGHANELTRSETSE